jgi:hypothetical protein
MKLSNFPIVLISSALSILLVGEAKGDILWDNGTFINHPGGMLGDALGADRSYVTPDGNVLGFGMTETFSVADNFGLSVDCVVDSLTFFGYTNGQTAPGATALYARIWDGNPSAGGNVVWGDMTTNILSVNNWLAGPSGLGVYRTRANEFTDNSRRIQEVSASGLNIDLAAGGYWLEWNVSGVWTTPPLNDAGAPNSLKWGDAIQFNSTTGVWTPLRSGLAISNPVDLGFTVSGTAVPEPGTGTLWVLLAMGGLLGMWRGKKSKHGRKEFG